MKKILTIAIIACLLAACGQSYEETKRISRQQRRELARKDSAALKIAVMPTLDCLPMFVAEHYQLFDTLRGGVRLKQFAAQMDCDTALERGRVEGAISDLVRAMRMERRGTKIRYEAATNTRWQLVTNRNARVRQLKQLDDKMVAMTRYSATDLLTDRVVDSVKLDKDRVFKVQINDVHVRLLMLQNNEMDALWLTEPQATVARLMKHNVVYDTGKENVQLGVLAFREKEMQRQARAQQLQLFVKAYDQACDSINKYGVRHYRDLIVKRCKMKANMVDSLPDDIKYEHARGPRERDVALAERWLGKK
ncbi:MAG: ABC transporter substrate-binding protein [Prevotella sp.]|nr:ABC transporter substrate-binding protein [Prevotella sp.]